MTLHVNDPSSDDRLNLPHSPQRTAEAEPALVRLALSRSQGSAEARRTLERQAAADARPHPSYAVILNWVPETQAGVIAQAAMRMVNYDPRIPGELGLMSAATALADARDPISVTRRETALLLLNSPVDQAALEEAALHWPEARTLLGTALMLNKEPDLERLKALLSGSDPIDHYHLALVQIDENNPEGRCGLEALTRDPLLKSMALRSLAYAWVRGLGGPRSVVRAWQFQRAARKAERELNERQFAEVQAAHAVVRSSDAEGISTKSGVAEYRT